MLTSTLGLKSEDVYFTVTKYVENRLPSVVMCKSSAHEDPMLLNHEF